MTAECESLKRGHAALEPAQSPTLSLSSATGSAASPDEAARPRKRRSKARTAEEKEMKAEERAERNKRAAQESRNRHRVYVEGLEDRVAQLTSENEALRHNQQSLEDRIAAMEKLLATAPQVPHAPTKDGASLPATSPSGMSPSLYSVDEHEAASLFDHSGFGAEMPAYPLVLDDKIFHNSSESQEYRTANDAGMFDLHRPAATVVAPAASAAAGAGLQCRSNLCPASLTELTLTLSQQAALTMVQSIHLSWTLAFLMTNARSHFQN